MIDSHVTLYQGDALSVLKTMPGESVDICMTSPPYYGLRNYHQDGQIGLEKTYQEYIDHLMQIFSEVKRVLKKTGTCWVNIGDSYNSAASNRSRNLGNAAALSEIGHRGTVIKTIPAKSLIGIPERFALAMTDRLGYIRRNTIIWYKRNPMPESVSDRMTRDFEYLYFFSKSQRYFFEQQFEGFSTATERWGGDKFNGNVKLSGKVEAAGLDRERNCYPNEQGRNKRCVWDIPTEGGIPSKSRTHSIPSKEPHYAAYPEKLCETPILAGCPAAVCTKCGKVREKIYDKGELITSGPNKMVNKTQVGLNEYHEKDPYGDLPKRELFDKGYSDCGCGASFEPGVVLDMFAGTGTTGCVAKKLGRKAILIELSPKYCSIIEKRISLIPMPMEFNL